MAKQSIYRIAFMNHDQIYELYAKSISESEMFGFIEVEEFLFGDQTSVVVDPSVERLELEFSGVKSSFIPMHAIIRIDVVDQEGVATVREASANGTNIRAFPGLSPKQQSNTPESS